MRADLVHPRATSRRLSTGRQLRIVGTAQSCVVAVLCLVMLGATASAATGPVTSPAPARIGLAGDAEPAVRVIRDVPFMRRQACADRPSTGCIDRVDIYVPRKGALPGPTIVLIHGRPRYPSDMTAYAWALARRGATVFNLDYRGVRPAVTLGFPRTMEDVACGIRYARANTARYGGRTDQIVLVGHSMGGYVGMLVALDGGQYPSTRGACLADHGKRPSRAASLPDGVVSVAGVSFMHPEYDIDDAYFGGDPEEVPGNWAKGDIYHQTWRRPDLPVGIIFETHDPFMSTAHATELAESLRERGHRVELILETTGRTHFDILDPDTTAGAAALRLIERVVERSASPLVPAAPMSLRAG
jgi:acetyl esterase/lipase